MSSLSYQKILKEGVRRTKGNESRSFNLLAAKLIADLIKNSLGPGGKEKLFVDILGEVTLTKDGATLLRKIDVEHPAAKVVIEASNAVDNEVGDGTISVVVLIGSLLEKAQDLLDLGINPTMIIDGYSKGLRLSLEIISEISQEFKNIDINIMEKLSNTCLSSKFIINICNDISKISKIMVDAICSISDFENKIIDTDNIKIEKKIGNIDDTKLINGIVIDKCIDNSLMPKFIRNAKILLTNDDLDRKRTKIDSEIQISTPSSMKNFVNQESFLIKNKIDSIIKSGVNVVISQKGIDLSAQTLLAKAGIISVKRVKENDLLWLERATGAKITNDLNSIIPDFYIGHAENVYEKYVGDDKIFFVEGCSDPKAVTLLLRANSRNILDELHRTVLDVISVLKNFIFKPLIVGGGGSTESILANRIRKQSYSIEGKEQLILQKFAESLEEIPLTIAKNAGMNIIDTFVELRSRNSNGFNDRNIKWYGIDATERKIRNVYSKISEPSIVKEQILKTAVEVSCLLLSVDDVLIAKPVMQTHTHADGTNHSHEGGDRKHDHYFDRLGKQQRPTHHYF